MKHVNINYISVSWPTVPEFQLLILMSRFRIDLIGLDKTAPKPLHKSDFWIHTGAIGAHKMPHPSRSCNKPSPNSTQGLLERLALHKLHIALYWIHWSKHWSEHWSSHWFNITTIYNKVTNSDKDCSTYISVTPCFSSNVNDMIPLNS